MNSILSRLGGNRVVTGGGGHSDSAYTASGDLPRPLDPRAFSKLFRRMDRVVKSLQNSRMNMSRSPPCMIDTLPDIYLKLKEINTYYEFPDRKPLLDQNDFFYITVNNIFDKCKRVNQLFKMNKEDVYCENSESRKQLVNLTIVISYIYADLKAIFPDAHFDPSFRVAKEEAERWWREMFPNKIIVPWAAFREQCTESFPPLNKLELSNLKSTIDLTCNDHVSIFEFDVFTRLFAPWSMLMKNFKKLTFHPGYMASATFENVIAILSRHKEKPGSYVFRMSCTKLGFWSIGYVTDQRREAISQIVVRDGKPIVEALVEGSQKGFYLYPNGEPTNPDLSDLLHVRPKPQFQVTESQFAEYSLIGSTFQECKICNQRDKDVRLDLCGHFLCSKCLNQWLSKGTGCPFCRCEIRSTQSIVMQPFPNKGSPPTVSREPPPIPEFQPRKESLNDDNFSRLPPSHPPPPLPPGFSETQEWPTPISNSPPRRKDSVPAPPNVPLPPPPVPDMGGRRPSVVGSTSVDSIEEQAGSNSNRTRTTSDRRPSTSSVLPSMSPNRGGMYVNLGSVHVPPDSLPLQADGARLSSDSHQPSSKCASPGSASSNDVFATPSPRSSEDPEKRLLARLPPPPPPPLPGVASPAQPVPTPRRNRKLPATPSSDQPDNSITDELTNLPPPPPPPINGPQTELDSDYHVPIMEDVYNVPSEMTSEPSEDLYNIPVDPYNIPVDPYNIPVDPYNIPVDPYNVPRDSSDPYNVPRQDSEEGLVSQVSARAAAEVQGARHDIQAMIRTFDD